ncbi:MAG: hypothetical protein MKZ70_06660, partial [Opitutales bacterium]|nr:hypothetical protein [Opitutales bacterium]
FFLACETNAFATSIEKGMNAIKNRNFSAAFAHLEPLAKDGDAVAQYNLRVMHIRGLGTKKNGRLAIKWLTLAASKEIREGRPEKADLLGRLADDDRIPLSLKRLESLLSQTDRCVGAAPKKVDEVQRDASKWTKLLPEALKVKPGRMLYHARKGAQASCLW